MNHNDLNSKFTWKKVFIIGAIIGILLGLIAYLWLVSIGNDLQREMSTKKVDIVKPLE